MPTLTNDQFIKQGGKINPTSMPKTMSNADFLKSGGVITPLHEPPSAHIALLQKIAGAQPTAGTKNSPNGTHTIDPNAQSLIETGAAPGAQAPKQGVSANLMGTGGVLDQGIKDYMSRVGKDYYGAAENMSQNIQDAGSGKQSPLSTALQNAGEGVKAVFSPISEILGPIVQGDANALANSKTFQKIAGTSVVDHLAGAASSVIEKYQAWAKENPVAAKNHEAAANVVMALVGEGPTNTIADTAVKTGADAVKSSLDAVTPAIEATKTAASEVAKDAAGNIVDIADKTVGKQSVAGEIAKRDAAQTNKIQEIISPKITSKETQAIINENRLTRGKDSIVFGKQPDIVAQSEAIQRSAQTIKDTIPNAAKMNDAQLSTALGDKITENALALKPKMQEVPVKLETLGKIRDAWASTKAEQQARPEFLDNKAGNTAFQGKFENYLKQLNFDIKNPETGKFKAPTQKTMNDVWDVRKAYDSSIPSNVKNATSNSSPVLQDRKAMWLENRSILSSTINDTATGLGDESKIPFSQMSDMYDAKENIAAKAKIDLEGKPGVLPNTTRGWLKLGAGAGATLIGGEWVLKKLGL